SVSPDGAHVYLSGGTVFARNVSTGELSYVPGAGDDASGCAEPFFTSDGLDAYASCGGGSSVSIQQLALFHRNPLTGSLAFVAEYRIGSTKGNVAYQVISADDKFIYSGIQATPTSLSLLIGVFARNPLDGTLTLTQTTPIDDANCGQNDTYSHLVITPD